MWPAISSVSSGIALVAFLAAAAVETMRRVLQSRERQITLAPEQDRLAMAQSLSDTFLVSGAPIDTTTLTKHQQYTIIVTQIRDRARRFYILAVALTAVAICAVIGYAISHRAVSLTGGARERATATAVWQKFYRQEFQSLYEGLPDQLKAQIRYADVLAEFKREIAQFPRPPLSRRFEYEGRNGAFWVVSQLVEFDALSTFREVTTFSRDDSGWQTYRMDIVPIEWPTSSTSAFLTQNAKQTVDRLAQLAPAQRNTEVAERFKDRFLPPPGWTLVVSGPPVQRADLTCDVQSQEMTDRTKVVLRRTLGGCALSSGTEMTALGRLSSANGDHVELESVRFLR